MKTTVVPAQVTTVEDRIMGSLGFSQLMLLIVPVFLSAGMYVGLPPLMGSAIYKFVLMGIVTLICCILAIRIKGKIVALWLALILRYNLRPTFYLFNKNVTTHREQYDTKITEPEEKPVKANLKRDITIPRLGHVETAKVFAAIDNPASKLRFETNKNGGLNVRLTEVQE